MAKVGNYVHVDENRIELSDLQIEILEDLQKAYPPAMFKTTAVDYRVKNTVGVNCKTCKSDNIYVVSKQLRSADEATTKIYTCLDCGYTWRVG